MFVCLFVGWLVRSCVGVRVRFVLTSFEDDVSKTVRDTDSVTMEHL